MQRRREQNMAYIPEKRAMSDCSSHKSTNNNHFGEKSAVGFANRKNWDFIIADQFILCFIPYEYAIISLTRECVCVCARVLHEKFLEPLDNPNLTFTKIR